MSPPAPFDIWRCDPCCGAARFDLIKVRIQTQIPGPDGKLPYTGAIDCVKKTLAREGPRALYKGMSAPLGGVVPIFSLCFLSYDAAKVRNP